MTVECPACHEQRAEATIHNAESVAPSLAKQIATLRPGWAPTQRVCEHCINAARAEEAAHLLLGEMGSLSNLDLEVVDSLRQGTMVLQNTAELDELPNLTIAERISQRVADTVGSFAFSFLVMATVGLWVTFGVRSGLVNESPALVFGTLSAALGTLAAIQNPIILMSQRRQARRDRLRNENDYRVNLKAELELRYLNQKLDYLTEKLVAQTQLIEGMEPQTDQ